MATKTHRLMTQMMERRAPSPMYVWSYSRAPIERTNERIQQPNKRTNRQLNKPPKQTKTQIN